MRNTADVTGGKTIAVLLQSISGVSAINPLVAFTTSMKERERCYSFILSRTPHKIPGHHTRSNDYKLLQLLLLQKVYYYYKIN
jgi:hypothetical protein